MYDDTGSPEDRLYPFDVPSDSDSELLSQVR